jgi:DNA-binding CsgD family transcriptional regulator
LSRWLSDADGIVDEIAIEVAMTGRRVQLTHAERDEVMRRLLAKGRSASEVAACLHVTARTVERYKKRVRNQRAVAQ